MFILSYALGKTLFWVFDVFAKQIMARFVKISFKLHEHVVCSPFESRTYFKHIFFIFYSKHGTKHIDQGPLHERV